MLPNNSESTPILALKEGDMAKIVGGVIVLPPLSQWLPPPDFQHAPLLTNPYFPLNPPPATIDT